jgi:CheY-like chemotaxis protein
MAHILVIDDEPHIRQIIDSILSHEGHRVDLAENGKVGLKMVETSAYDLVITDIVMPEMDGLEVIRALSQKTPRIKVIAISGGTFRLDQNNLLSLARAMRVQEILKKPINYEELSMTVNNVLAG